MGDCAFDHLVVTAPSLEAGARYVQQTLGVPLQKGGEHTRMGTHNLLLSLGATTYLEVISINPAAAPAGRPRWFGLDDCLAADVPRLSAWVARSDNIEASLAEAREDLGSVESMSRGEFEWRITVPPNGRPSLDGVVPALIQWPSGVHPARRLKDLGCRLRRLEAFHSDPARVSSLFERLGLAGVVSVAPLQAGVAGHLAATIDTPAGPRSLATPYDRPWRL